MLGESLPWNETITWAENELLAAELHMCDEILYDGIKGMWGRKLV